MCPAVWINHATYAAAVARFVHQHYAPTYWRHATALFWPRSVRTFCFLHSRGGV
jgi:hypothetical protein